MQKLIKLWIFSMVSFGKTTLALSFNKTSQSTKGTEFVIGFMDNISNNIQLMVLNAPENEAAANVTVTSPHASFSSVISVNSSYLLSLPSTLLHSGNERSTKGVRVSSNLPVSVYVINGKNNAVDTYLAFPNSILDKDYFVVTYSVSTIYSDGRSQFLVIGVEDDTTDVEITVTGTIKYGPLVFNAGDSFFLPPLNALDSVQFQSQSDLTGSKVSSSKILSVFSGNKCDNVPINAKFCNHMDSQVPPINLWGDTYITTPLATRSAGDIFRVMAAEDGTTVTISGLPSPITLISGQFYEIDVPSTESWLIEADGPILVAQFCKGGTADSTDADPFMLILPSLDNFITGTHGLVTFDILERDEKYFINIIVDCSAKNHLFCSPSMNITWLNTTQHRGLCIGTAGFSNGSYSCSQEEEVDYQILAYSLGSSTAYGHLLALQFGKTEEFTTTQTVELNTGDTDASLGTGNIIAIIVSIPFAIAFMLIITKILLKRLKKRNYIDHENSQVNENRDSFTNNSRPNEGGTELKEVNSIEMLEYSDTVSEIWEFPRNKIKILEKLGSGEFGKVMKAEAYGFFNTGGESTIVAIKIAKENCSLDDKNNFISELEFMKKLAPHPNVVSLLGCCTECEPYYIILEYLPYGDLRTYLKNHRIASSSLYTNIAWGSEDLTNFDLLSFATDVAKGMAYLSSMKCVHRDLAARNVLVGENRVCKVSDFGFSRDVNNTGVYEKKTKGRRRLPIRWMALESLIDNRCTLKSDVWSFGVLLWEIVSLGCTPYPGITAARLISKLQEGFRLPMPINCSTELYEIMLKCWSDEDDRPSFTDIVQNLERLREIDRVLQIYLYHLAYAVYIFSLKLYIFIFCIIKYSVFFL